MANNLSLKISPEIFQNKAMTRAWKKYKYHDHTETRKISRTQMNAYFLLVGNNKLINSFSENMKPAFSLYILI